MRQVPDWPEYFLDLARVTASRSKDPNTQVGAVIVNDDGRIVAQGYNGMIAGAFDTHDCWSDECKHDHVIHAEVNAIANAARTGVSTLNAKMFITLAPCLPCMRIVAAAGIKHLIVDHQATKRWLAVKPGRMDGYHQSQYHARKAQITWTEI